MADLGTAIAAALNAATPVTALTQCFVPEYAPQRETYPQVVYEIKDAAPDETYGGASGLVSAKAVVHCIATTMTGADALSAAVKAALMDEEAVFGGVTVQGIFLEEDSKGDYTNPQNENLTLFEHALTFECWYDDQ